MHCLPFTDNYFSNILLGKRASRKPLIQKKISSYEHSVLQFLIFWEPGIIVVIYTIKALTCLCAGTCSLFRSMILKVYTALLFPVYILQMPGTSATRPFYSQPFVVNIDLVDSGWLVHGQKKILASSDTDSNL